MEKQHDRELKDKKEKLRWILTAAVIVLVIFGLMLNRYLHKFKESTVTDLFEIAVSDYREESYSTGKIRYEAENIEDNKKLRFQKKLSRIY